MAGREQTRPAGHDAASAPHAACDAAPAPRLQARDVTCGYDGTPVLSHVSFSLHAGEVCCVLGPNGIGKTTLFRSLLGTLPLLGGEVLLGGRSIAQMSRADVARAVGYVPQAHTPPFPFTVVDVVEMGRTAHLSALQSPSRADRELALQALNTLGIAHLQDRLYTQLSGGERQMVLIARALVQRADVLVMDEPTASLDFGNQADVLGYVRQLAAAGYSVLMTTHSPDHAFLCADTVVAVRAGACVAAGPADEVLSERLLEELYGMRAAICELAAPDGTARRVVVPAGRSGADARQAAIETFLHAN